MGTQLSYMKDVLLCNAVKRKVFNAIDTDKSGYITKYELADFIADERYLGNRFFPQHKSLESIVDQMWLIMDTNGDKRITREELYKYLDTLSEEQVKQLGEDVGKAASKRKHEVLKRVYDALDTDDSGRVSKREILFWLENERSWRQFGETLGLGELNERGREKIFRKMDLNEDGYISFSELVFFFRDWTIKEIREFTLDQEYYDQLEEYGRNPTKENKKKLRLRREDSQYSREVTDVLNNDADN